MYRDAHSHLQPPTPAAQGACGLIPGQKEALSTEGEGTEAETVVHMMCRAVNKHMRTLFPDTHRGARERGESGRQTQGRGTCSQSLEDRSKQNEDRYG